MLMLNQEKSELIVFKLQHQEKTSDKIHFQVEEETVNIACTMKMSDHAETGKCTSNACYYHIQYTDCIKEYTEDASKTQQTL